MKERVRESRRFFSTNSGTKTITSRVIEVVWK